MLTKAPSLAFALMFSTAAALHADGLREGSSHRADEVQLGPRPFYLVDGMSPGSLKNRLSQCKDGPFRKSDFSIGHRGACLQFPEHTQESYDAAARMGAGIVECDVTFTRDGELVCRHSECDLHTTTNIVDTDAQRQVHGALDGSAVDARHRPQVLHQRPHPGRVQDASRERWTRAMPRPPRPQGYLGGTASWRTDLYTGRGTLLTLRESIALNERNGVKHTPELKERRPGPHRRDVSEARQATRERSSACSKTPASIPGTSGCSRSTRRTCSTG